MCGNAARSRAALVHARAIRASPARSYRNPCLRYTPCVAVMAVGALRLLLSVGQDQGMLANGCRSGNASRRVCIEPSSGWPAPRNKAELVHPTGIVDNGRSKWGSDCSLAALGSVRRTSRNSRDPRTAAAQGPAVSPLATSPPLELLGRSKELPQVLCRVGSEPPCGMFRLRRLLRVAESLLRVAQALCHPGTSDRAWLTSGRQNRDLTKGDRCTNVLACPVGRLMRCDRSASSWTVAELAGWRARAGCANDSMTGQLVWQAGVVCVWVMATGVHPCKLRSGVTLSHARSLSGALRLGTQPCPPYAHPGRKPPRAT